MYVEDCQLTQKEAVHLLKDFTAVYACAEVEDYLCMVEEGQQNFEGLIQHLTCALCLGELTAPIELNISVGSRRPMKLRKPLWKIYKF